MDDSTDAWMREIRNEMSQRDSSHSMGTDASCAASPGTPFQPQPQPGLSSSSSASPPAPSTFLMTALPAQGGKSTYTPSPYKPPSRLPADRRVLPDPDDSVNRSVAADAAADDAAEEDAEDNAEDDGDGDRLGWLGGGDAEPAASPTSRLFRNKGSGGAPADGDATTPLANKLAYQSSPRTHADRLAAERALNDSAERQELLGQVLIRGQPGGPPPRHASGARIRTPASTPGSGSGSKSGGRGSGRGGVRTPPVSTSGRSNGGSRRLDSGGGRGVGDDG